MSVTRRVEIGVRQSLAATTLSAIERALGKPDDLSGRRLRKPHVTCDVR